MKLLKIIGVFVIIVVILYVTYSYLFKKENKNTDNPLVSEAKDNVTGEPLTRGVLSSPSDLQLRVAADFTNKINRPLGS